MTLPAMNPARKPDGLADSGASSPDPYGLWETPPPAIDEAVSFGEAGASAPGADVAAVWRLPLVSGDPQAGKVLLDRRARQVAAIEAGLEEAGARLDAFLDQRRQPGGGVSFGPAAAAPNLPAPEAELASALAALESGQVAEGAANYGLSETAAQVAGAVSVDWNGLQERFAELMDKVNRQLLHAAWVDTTLDGQLVARTTITWCGDLTTLMLPTLEPETVQAHKTSLEQAIASEAANVKTVLTVAQLAGKIALAATTPIGAVQALALGWQFVRTVMSEQQPVNR